MRESAFARRFDLAFETHPRIRMWSQKAGQALMLLRRDEATMELIRGLVRDGVLGWFPLGPEGAADRTGILLPTTPGILDPWAGLRLEFELKGTGGKERPAQKIWAANMERWGAIHALVEAKHGVDAAVRTVEAAIERRIAAILRWAQQTGPRP